ncbi:MAG: hypothetical protein HC900_03205 [Methylacidiphilales bacterium]|nr:hypothetical protein [Candidatus Methylacidiphilales bacterium]
MPNNITLIFLPSRSPEMNPVETIWQHLRGNWLSNRVFDTCGDILDAACDAWRRLTPPPKTKITVQKMAHPAPGRKIFV